LRATFPAGTVSGAPKVRAMQIISELEQYRRGIYAGAVGYFLPERLGLEASPAKPPTPGLKTAPPSAALGELDTCIAIRTLWLRDGVAHLQAGGGIVADSDPAAEHEECLAKLRALETAIDLAESEQDAAP
jgi:anthranilate synthase component 1